MIDGFNGMSTHLLCRNEICQKPWVKCVKNIPSVDPNPKVVTSHLYVYIIIKNIRYLYYTLLKKQY